MTKYKVINYFQWGKLKLNKNQVLCVEKKDSQTSLVYIEHYPEKSQLVNTKAVESMIFLKKIEEY